MNFFKNSRFNRIQFQSYYWGTCDLFFGNILICKSWNLDGLAHIWYIYPKEFVDVRLYHMREDQLFVPVYQIVMVASISPLICHSFIYNYPISKNSLAVLWIECLNALYIFFNRYNRISTHEYNNFFIIMLRYQLILT